MFNEKIYPYLLVTVQFACLLFLLRTGPLLAEGYGGIMVESAGIFVGILAIYHMGLGNFNISPRLKENAQLVTHGIYRYIRHPMYSAQLIALLPLVVEHPQWFRIFAYILLLVALLLKIHYEEARLRMHFEDYEDYMKKTKRLVPLLY